MNFINLVTSQTLPVIFDSLPLVEDISLSIPPGELICVFGKQGHGMTALCKDLIELKARKICFIKTADQTPDSLCFSALFPLYQKKSDGILL